MVYNTYSCNISLCTFCSIIHLNINSVYIITSLHKSSTFTLIFDLYTYACIFSILLTLCYFFFIIYNVLKVAYRPEGPGVKNILLLLISHLKMYVHVTINKLFTECDWSRFNNQRFQMKFEFILANCMDVRNVI